MKMEINKEILKRSLTLTKLVIQEVNNSKTVEIDLNKHIDIVKQQMINCFNNICEPDNNKTYTVYRMSEINGTIVGWTNIENYFTLSVPFQLANQVKLIYNDKSENALKEINLANWITILSLDTPTSIKLPNQTFKTLRVDNNKYRKYAIKLFDNFESLNIFNIENETIYIEFEYWYINKLVCEAKINEDNNLL